jgi:hypothetical protein
VQPIGVKDIDDDRLDTDQTEELRLVCGTRCAGYLPAIRDQQAAQGAANHAACAGDQDAFIP